MKLYKGLIEATVHALQHIFSDKQQADRVVERLLKSNPKWGARDRAFLAENIYEIVRWWRLIKFSAGMEKVTQPADFWKIVGVWQIIKPTQLHLDTDNILPEWAEFEGINIETVLNRYQEALKVRKIAQSVPDWIDEIGEKELGEKWEKELTALNNQAPFVLRVNTLKSDLKTVISVFGEDKVETVAEIPTALVLKKRQNVAGQDSYKKGFFEIQDAGSQLITPFMDLHPGQTVIDACAGAGGKTLQIAAALQNKGRIISLDIENFKLEELQKRATRNGVKILSTGLIKSDKTIKELVDTADRLLLDVPCSGLGILRRNPDTKWKLQPTFLNTIRNTQWNILSTYSKMVKRGGKMVYATCSLLPSESENQVTRFIMEFGDRWRLIDERRTSVADEGYDGFYMALLERIK
ncbi:RsmB/NOP family class I SAM-dependent RNA methyltransferase [Dyadobacter sp. LHD-138]|uniref:RsmB/NOP family class I SAM-dependent RNA methyltransferase n=1 Tax=Dyadobacter sp. LHD-138 TaxID=3071413 RepID=UPI0027E0DAA9|nr:RsmB/NOP family class I SAM-dependent RNA methyltransferase [Dyadobacter sp. LHD-138]MDQ6480298.1 RsmB/NOP family class I SAM-dependent RNA methyltransferase [Dyadobacter sp. LHD-138]